MKFKLLLLSALAATSAMAFEPKEDPNAITPEGVRGGGGVGPDIFGYTGTDSNSGACTSQFIDITGTGANIITGDDAGAPVTLGAPFNFYGTVYTDLALTTNGYISTDVTDAGPDLSNDCPLPATPSTGGGARMYPLQDDLITNGGVYYEYFPVCPRPSDTFVDTLGCHVVQWDGVEHFGGGGEVFGFEAILYDLSWEIVFVQGTGNPEAGSGSTTGIQNDGATDGLTYACDTAASVPASSAQCFIHPNPDPAALPPILPVPTNNKVMLATLAGALGLIALFLMRRKAII
ncbi:hypothetical protein ACFODZ_08070 [Marinicella sediminis]|uniref:IPTL-CTERM sorting domain-containing protein n=1 Tax=Marinicella sediminis TaxID=1792834 RepID=A0ABV7J7U2_9GAMM|nr:hypothetical protein [Marinicella sediminis]